MKIYTTTFAYGCYRHGKSYINILELSKYLSGQKTAKVLSLYHMYCDGPIIYKFRMVPKYFSVKLFKEYEEFISKAHGENYKQFFKENKFSYTPADIKLEKILMIRATLNFVKSS